MSGIISFVKRHPLSTLLMAGIWTVCLVPIPETPLSHVSFIDKWTHSALYAILGLSLWFEHFRHHRQVAMGKVLLLAFVAPAAMGGLIEMAQAYCTGGNRSGEWLDFWADCVGLAVAALIGMLRATCLSRWKKGG